MDYQDAHYAGLYLDRLLRGAAADDGAEGHRLTRETARYLALWMSYDDVIRVAELKTRGTRMERVRGDVHAKDGQIMQVTEYMHPRFEEVCEILPARLGATLQDSTRARRWSAPLFGKGRHVVTTGLGWFLVLATLAAARRFRRGTLRYREEQARIMAWLDLVVATATTNLAAARELSECPRLIKGYSDTFLRGLAHHDRITAWFVANRDDPDAAVTIARMRESALEDVPASGSEVVPVPLHG